MKPILLATDGSPSAAAATAEAIDLASVFDAPLVVVSVAHVALPPYGGYYGYGEIAVDMKKTENEHVATVLRDVEEQAIEAGLACEPVALEGLPAEQICRTAELQEARLIVIGAHGWGRIGRLLHGSVSTDVLHEAGCPVLVVHGEPPATATASAAAAAAARVES
jgi:nucleotide-binding universal stress UspA family protein